MVKCFFVRTIAIALHIILYQSIVEIEEENPEPRATVWLQTKSVRRRQHYSSLRYYYSMSDRARIILTRHVLYVHKQPAGVLSNLYTALCSEWLPLQQFTFTRRCLNPTFLPRYNLSCIVLDGAYTRRLYFPPIKDSLNCKTLFFFHKRWLIL